MNADAEQVIRFIVEQLDVSLTTWQIRVIEHVFEMSHDSETGIDSIKPRVSNARTRAFRLPSTMPILIAGQRLDMPTGLDGEITLTNLHDWRQLTGRLAALWRLPAPVGACPVCHLRDGFHDHGEEGSLHDAHQVPPHLVRVSKSAARRAERERRHVEDPWRFGAIY